MAAALETAGLPVGDLGDAGLDLYAYDRDGDVVGYGALESHGQAALLRSVVVEKAARGVGIGSAISRGLLALAQAAGFREVYLLTTDQQGFFERLGFAKVERSAAPDAILHSRQARQLCPASAVLMRRTVEPHGAQ
jgi:N-acetylglutamate synthase-like GNAT family acetyltransferase